VSVELGRAVGADWGHILFKIRRRGRRRLDSSWWRYEGRRVRTWRWTHVACCSTVPITRKCKCCL